MPRLLSVVSWVAMVLLIVPLAVLLLLAIPTGALAQIAMHVILLVAGAALVLGLRETR